MDAKGLGRAALLLLAVAAATTSAEVLNPPYFNLAEGRQVTASATCGEGVPEPELYCKLVGATGDRRTDHSHGHVNLIYGQVCDFCDPSDPERSHPPSHAVDGSERWWQSPPLSRGNRYNEVNLTIDLGQEFHVAYVFIKMGNSPRPGLWILERSVDNGQSYLPWQYFADTPGDCVQHFGPDSLQALVRDDAVICETKFSKVVPLEGGEIVVSLLNDRPNADNFSYSPVLQEWTKATNIRLRFLRTKTLLGHLMSVARQDPTVTRRYFYSIKDINIGGRCVCNGHAETCDLSDPRDPYKLLCRCQHNTCGPQCGQCCPGFQQKMWRRAIIDNPFVCEPCNCFGHSDECVYDEKIDRARQSLDIHGHYEGGGVCQNCRHNTQGVNCNECKPTFFRPYGKLLNASDVCQPCNCDLSVSTGNCADGNGQCECRPEFLPPYCDSCNHGYYGWPEFCRPCDCHADGTYGDVCEVGGGQCPCRPSFGGLNCDRCQEGFYGFPNCLRCNCNPLTSERGACDADSGQCVCKGNYGGRQCDRCNAGYYNYPSCDYCACDPTGCVEEICDSLSGVCICKPGYGGPGCDRCAPGYSGYPKCEECNCDKNGSRSYICDVGGRCQCLPSFSGPKCDRCSPGYYNFPECLPCNCESRGSIGVTCNDDGQCFCKDNFDHPKCDICKDGFYNYPYCEECNCNPAGVLPTFLGCGSVTSGKLCECKERVSGRICNECKPLYWNLKISNSLGCEDCNCFLGGTVGGIAVCGTTNGQCMCKPNVGSRKCDQCKEGSYRLNSDDLFGCTECGCDIGGAVNNACDRDSGQCQCRPRISGRRCERPLQTHYFPTLFQHQYEVEDGRTPSGTQVRLNHDESAFPGYSWRGYAVFSKLQREVLLDLFIEKPSLYQVYFHYLNYGGDNVYGIITFTPETFGDIQQSSDMVFPVTSNPQLMKVSGKEGLVASPFVLNPGQWTVSIRVEKPLFLDYMVLLPQAYYEATLLQEHVTTPCVLGAEDSACLAYRFPPLPPQSDVVRGETGFVPYDYNDRRRTTLFEDASVLEVLQTDGPMAWIGGDQSTLHLQSRVSVAGAYVVVVTYHTPEEQRSTTATVEVTTAGGRTDQGTVTLYDCAYTFLCRQVVVSQEGEVSHFEMDEGEATVVMDVNEETSLAIDSVAFVPADLWHTDFIVPQVLCVNQEGQCLEADFPAVPESTKVEFDGGYNIYKPTSKQPERHDDGDDVSVVSIHKNVTELKGAVPTPGLYTFVIHYYQPDHPSFEVQVVIEDGESHVATLPLSFCPGIGGCRAVVVRDGHETAFNVLQNFHISIQRPQDKTFSVEYVLAIPSIEYQETVLSPLAQDKAGKFIKECGQNSFLLPADITGFCRDAVFSLTSEYNNGALPCQCSPDGSLSYECGELGGQCQCRPHVVGRTCSRCRTGFFGFPNCRPCDCPAIAYCQPVTGQCICPPRVQGERCDSCVPYTYGFDGYVGCEECNCNHLGVVRGNLQCDLQSGQCQCKPNIVGRTCDKCKAGYWAFPHCQLCNCDLRGSTEDICDEDSARCHCKANVYGDSCDQCKPGTFYLEEVNPLGCTKCFCFGTTDRCSSGYFFKTQVYEMRGWEPKMVKMESSGMTASDLEDTLELSEAEEGIQVTNPPQIEDGNLLYFSAPDVFLGNKISSYGGNFTYTITFAVDSDSSLESFVGPDLIIFGSDLTLVHDHIEQPAAGLPFRVNVNFLEREFRHASGREVTREQMMMALVKLDALLIRGSYFQPVTEISLTDVLMDTATDQYVADAPQALRVEQCQCPPGYTGNSCENCAPGYYRSKNGPYLSYCVPCECNGHAQSCDVNTGICLNCQHNTIGDHCEKCAPGYHGDSTQGSPYDCLICACPLPLESNNFAESCELSPSGQEISCVCKPGYFGPRCEVCALGFFGSPETVGDSCHPCDCNGNIDRDIPGSCDSVTGECVLCLNDTAGSACEICKPGFYGDAVNYKNCRKCACDECGTAECNHGTGQCVCWPNVVGPHCDRCAENHWGFDSCGGCRPCNCGPASRSDQCNLVTGQCDCQPGAAGLTCDICEPGYWQYSERGCTSCNCDEKYSAGAVCNPVTGICQCLPGVLGDKCDSCPYRWVFVKNQGCLECEGCVHGLLDVTDQLEHLISPVMVDMKDVSLSYFANKRLQNLNATADTLRIGVNELLSDPSGLDYSPLVYEVQNIEKDRDNLLKMANSNLSQAEAVAKDSAKTKEEALEVQKLIGDAITKVQGIVGELSQLSEGLRDSVGPDVEALLFQAEAILEELRDRQFKEAQKEAENEDKEALILLNFVKEYEAPVLDIKMRLKEENDKQMHLSELLSELKNNSQGSLRVADKARNLREELQRVPLQEMIDRIENEAEAVNEILKNASDLLAKTKDFNKDAKKAHENLEKDAENLLLSITDLKDNIKDTSKSFEDIQEPIDEATKHADFLMGQADLLDRSLSDTRGSADAAVKAANAYSNIEEAINDAFKAAEAAYKASNEASLMPDDLLSKTRDSKENTSQLLDTALQLEEEVKELEPQLRSAKEGVLLIGHQNVKTSRGLDAIKKDLDKLPLDSVGALAALAADDSAQADQKAGQATKDMEIIMTRLPEDKIRAKQVPKDVEEARQAIKAAHSYADRVASIPPDMNQLIDKASKKESEIQIMGQDLSEKIAKLRQKVAVARTVAHNIKLGVQFFENTTLQLRNPENLEKAATYTLLSMFFKTTERFGLLAFIGNERGTHTQMKRVLTDDYLALEIRGGRLVLVMDIGSGQQDINHDAHVSDGKWHQVIVERTGKTCSITVRSENEPDSVGVGYLPGTFSVFNLDQKLSKFYIGGVEKTNKLPDTLLTHHFDGCIEDVEFGGTPMGLWDFVSATNNFEGCAERDVLGVPPTTGLRFNGAGYAILAKKRHQFAQETHIRMRFKTYAQDGLLFLIGKNGEFFALELEEGHVVLKYNLGSGSTTLRSPDAYNDGQWHSIEATRVDTEAVLKVDQQEVDSGATPGPEDSLQVSNQIYIGGHPRKHSFKEVSNVGFEGCITDMQLSAEVIDLNKHKEALGVVNGCPVTIARTVSFGPGTGYLGMPLSDLRDLSQLTLKFKTAQPDGLLLFAATPDQRRHLSLSLSNGSVVLRVEPGGTVSTGRGTPAFHDSAWHYAVATVTPESLRLDLDDFFSSVLEVAEGTPALEGPAARLFFAGAPFSIIEGPSFVGCIGDATVNNKFQNFADSQDKEGASLASCPLEDPAEPPQPTTGPDEEEVDVTEQPPAPTQPTFDEDVDDDYRPQFRDECALPLNPRRSGAKAGEGARFGNAPHSRRELAPPGGGGAAFMESILEESTFALEFRTSPGPNISGVMFYVGDKNHIDFVGLVMHYGKILFVFNCGSGVASVASQNTYSDGEWHRVVFSRRLRDGRLLIDDSEEVRGSSSGGASSLNVLPPFFVGGLSQEVARQAKNNLKGINLSFPGCIRNVEAQGELLDTGSLVSANTSSCSDRVEEGTFFGADGGYLALYDKYRVGNAITITMDIRPRSANGILMAVHGKLDYLILQIVDGTVIFQVDNGAGNITATVTPTQSLCDGNFHTIQAAKSRNVITLSVDENYSPPGLGVGGVSATDTKDPLYLGGVPPENLERTAVFAKEPFVGCIRSLEIDRKVPNIAESRVFGQVTLNTCPAA